MAGADLIAVYCRRLSPTERCTCTRWRPARTLKMRVLNSVKQFASTSVQIDMPEGYEDAIMLALAIRMAPG